MVPSPPPPCPSCALSLHKNNSSCQQAPAPTRPLQTQQGCRVLKGRISRTEVQISEYAFRVGEAHGTWKKEGVNHWARIPAAEGRDNNSYCSRMLRGLSEIINTKCPNTARQEQMLNQCGVLSILAVPSKMPEKSTFPRRTLIQSIS